MPCYKVSLFRLCSQRHQSRNELSMEQMFWMSARKMFRTLKWRSSDWACGPCSTPPPTSLPPPTTTPPTDKKSDDSTFTVLQLYANGIGNKLTELGVVMDNNKVKVKVIQESKLTPKSKNPCIHNYTTVRKDRPHGQGGGLLIFIHISVTFSKQPSSAESLYDPPPGRTCHRS